MNRVTPTVRRTARELERQMYEIELYDVITQRALAEGLVVEELSEILRDLLRGYNAAGEQTGPFLWNAVDDEIDFDGLAKGLRERLLGEEL